MVRKKVSEGVCKSACIWEFVCVCVRASVHVIPRLPVSLF